MPTYTKDDYERIAAALGKNVAAVLQHKHVFEAAATWYRLDIPTAKREGGPTWELRNQRRGRPKDLSVLPGHLPRKPKTPSELRKKAKQIEAAARKLLRHLEVYHLQNAPDGPGDRDLLFFLSSMGGVTEEEVTRATARIGRLAELLSAIDAAKSLEACAGKAAQKAVSFAKLLPKGHQGDVAAIGWIAAMALLYRRITGQEPRMSVFRPGPGRGQPAGPFLRFLQAAAKPLKIRLSPASARSRLRALKRAGERRQK